MARLLPENFVPEELNIEIKEVSKNCTEVFYVPDEVDLKSSGVDFNSGVEYREKIVIFDGENNIITIRPIITIAHYENYLSGKYRKICEISVEVDEYEAPYDKKDAVYALSLLPAGFIKDVRYGLGLKKEYRSIISSIEEHTESKFIFIGNCETGDAGGGVFNLSQCDYHEMRRLCNLITDRARKAAKIKKDISTYNRIAYSLGVEQKISPIKSDEISRMMGVRISNKDRSEAMEIIMENKMAVKQTDSITLAKLKNDIELVSLERLIDSYEELLGKDAKENTWQELFNQNPFILSLAFGYPAIKISDQVSVGGKRLNGNGEKITDFLMKNDITNNLALIEIKKPSSRLLNKAAYRDYVYCASTELTGSVAQVLDQCYHLQQNINIIKNNSKCYDVESYAVHCILIIGKMPSGEDEKKSFEIYRRNSKNVQITTFDELLFKLRELHKFLGSNDEKKDAAP